MDDRKAAFILFKNGASGKEVAKILGRTEKTISTWRKKDNWDEKLAKSTLQEETSRETVYDLINYQLCVLKKIKDDYEKAGGKQLIARGDIDALQKLFTTVKGPALEWSNIVTIMRKWMEWLKIEDLNAAQDITSLVDKYLNYLRKNM
jgi:hypothetical protein